MGKTHKHHIGGRKRTRRLAHIVNALAENLPGAREHGGAEHGGKFAPALQFIRCDRTIGLGVGRQPQARDEMHEFCKIGENERGIGALIILLFQSIQGGGDIALHDIFKQIDNAGAIGDAEHVADRLRANLIGGGGRAMGNGLIKQRERIAHRAFGGARHKRQSLTRDADIFLGANAGQMIDQHIRFDAAQIETLAARAHRHGDFFNLGCGEEKTHMRGRLFQRLQKAVECGLREHVHFVDNVDFAARHDRAIARALNDLANIVNAGVGGSIHFDHIDMAAFDDRLAMHAKLRHVDGWPIDAFVGHGIIEGARQNARSRRFADAAHAGQNIGLMDAVELESIGERSHHGFLADQILKTGGAIFARQHTIFAGRLFAHGRRAEIEAERGRIAVRA